MLRALVALPDRVELERNGVPFSATRSQLGALRIDGSLRIADPEFLAMMPPLPLQVPPGTHAVHAYTWHHPAEPVHVAVALRWHEPAFPRMRRLRVGNPVRPDLDAGVMVDSARLVVAGQDRLDLPSGFGDGYYPVYAIRNAIGRSCGVVVDFKIWEVRDVIAPRGWICDAYAVWSPPEHDR